jgi:phosphopantothenoylcysteine decarboxylase/phosphopantothenate--cysteine ligase
MLQGREILIGVTGGIAAFKTAALTSQLVQAGAGVTVVMTEAARQFVGAATFEALTGRPVPQKLFGDADHPLGPHITLAERAEVLCVAPATANFLAKTAHGMADDLLSTLILAFRGPLIVAPAMNSAMWEKPAVQRNLNQLREDGVHIVDPDSGWLSCRQQGTGRMASPEDIKKEIERVLGTLEPRRKDS